MSKLSTRESNDVFADPVAYLARFGIDAVVVNDTHGDEADQVQTAA